jgi:hypothetical protein
MAAAAAAEVKEAMEEQAVGSDKGSDPEKV